MLRRAILLVVLAVFMFVLPPVSAAAQVGAASLIGHVVDETGAAVPGVLITVRRSSTASETRIESDTEGAFSISELAAGDYEITATSAGFALAVQRVSLRPGEARRIPLQLRVGGLTEDVVVVAAEIAGSHERLRRLPGSVDIVDRETLEKSRVMTTNDALRKVAGVHVRDEEGFGLRPNIGIRGLNPTRANKVLLLEDGILLTYAPYGDNATYYHPPIDRFERIEVLKGGAQIAYGPQTIAGAVNYVTPKPPAQRSGSVSLTGGNRDYFNGHGSYGATVGRTGFLIDFMRKQGDGSRENLDFKLNDVNGKVVQTVGAGQTLTLRANYYGEDSNVTYSGLRQDEYLANPRANPFRNDFFYADRYGASATHAFAVSGDLAMTTNLYWNSFRRHWWRQSSNSAQRPNDSADPLCGSMANLNTTCGNEGRLREYYVWGIEPRISMHHRIFGISSETDFGVRAHFEHQDRLQENGSTPTARSGDRVESNVRTNDAYASFVQNSFLFGGWTVTPGIRLEHVRFVRTNRLANAGAGVTGETDLTRIIPGIGVSHTTGEQITVFGGVHRGFAPPRTEDIISNTGGVIDLDPELSWNYEAGIRSTMRPGVSVDATFFRMDYENQVIPASLAGGVGATLTNGGATLHQGIELRAQIDTAPIIGSSHDAYLRLAYTYLPVAEFSGTRFSNIPGFGMVSVSGNRLPYAPEQVVSIGVGYARGPIDLLLEAVRTSDQFGDDLNTVAPTPDGQRGLLSGYTVWNTAMNYMVARATLFLAVKNLQDELFIVDRTRGILPGSPRLVQAGVKFAF
ncbi:MAG TPA: TonB-dependent receptor [Vicinamibacterales bacterium]|nr:TonB-dependent receptor [Vicinamibacterales bacterium]